MQFIKWVVIVFIVSTIQWLGLGLAHISPPIFSTGYWVLMAITSIVCVSIANTLVGKQSD